MIVKLPPGKDNIKINESDDVYAIMQRILLRDNKIDREKEHFWIVGLNQGGYLLFIELVSLGSVKQTLVEPMNVFRVAILKGATRVIAVHNHPGGSLKPTPGDKDTTDRLIQVGKIINIQVEDHLIITPTSFVSFGDLGLMAELEESTKYVPTYQLIERIREEERIIRQALEKQLEAQELQFKYYRADMIHALREKGMEISEIASVTKLEEKEVEKILKKKKKKE